MTEDFEQPIVDAEIPVPPEASEAPPSEPATAPPPLDFARGDAISPPGGDAEPAEAPPAVARTDYDAATKPLTAGEIVSGLVVHVDEFGALIDVGQKAEGLLPPHELRADDGSEVAVGDSVDVYVVKPEDEDGKPVLSKKKADYEKVWHRIIKASETGEVVSAMVTDRVKGGLVVDLGLRGFLPASHVNTRNLHTLERFVGQSLRLKIIEVDRARKRVVVSHRQAVEEERQKKRERVVASLEEGQVRKGIVRRLTDYGAFVDLGGVDGLLHVTEMSWTRIKHPSDVVKVGDKIEVMILKYNRDNQRISLGLKQILPDPWQQVGNLYHVGDIVTGKVSRVVPFGAFVQLEAGIEGIIPTAELSSNRVTRTEGVIAVDDEVRAKILTIKRAERRLTLSLRQIQQDQERQQYEEHQERQRDTSGVTLGDLVGDALSQARENTAETESAVGPELAPAPGPGQNQDSTLPADAAAAETEEPSDEAGSASAVPGD